MHTQKSFGEFSKNAQKKKMELCLKLLRKRVTSALRSPLGTLVFCFGLLSVGYVLQSTVHFVDRKDGEEFYIDDEDSKIMEKMSHRLEESGDKVDQEVSVSPSLSKKNVRNNDGAKSIEQLDWQEVVDTNDDLYVYSAYYDINFRLIRVIAVANKHRSQSLECRFADDSTAVIGRSKAQIKIIRESKEYPFSAAFVLCPFPPGIVGGHAELPKYVSVASTRFNYVSPTANIMEIQYPAKNPPSKFAVCVQPTFNYDNSVRFVEWIEFHRSLGVERFTLYNISIGPSVSCIINEYNSLNARDENSQIFIEVLPWGNPSDRIISNVTIKQQNQLAALNDCVYRQRGFSQYVLNIDLDEFMTPHEDDNYANLIKRLDWLSGKNRIGVYEFRNAFFYPVVSSTNESEEDVSGAIRSGSEEATSAPEESATNESTFIKSDLISQLVTLEHVVRMAEPHSSDYRTKYICKPLRLVEAGIHNAFEMPSGFGTLNVPIQIGILHHYRDFQKLPTVEDPTARNLSIKYEIANKVISRFSSFRKTCSRFI